MPPKPLAMPPGWVDPLAAVDDATREELLAVAAEIKSRIVDRCERELAAGLASTTYRDANRHRAIIGTCAILIGDAVEQLQAARETLIAHEIRLLDPQREKGAVE